MDSENCAKDEIKLWESSSVELGLLGTGATHRAINHPKISCAVEK